MRRRLAIGIWAYATWVLLTWTTTPDELIFGAGLAAAAALVLAPLGPVAEPWRLLDPRRFLQVFRIAAHVAVNMVRANIDLSRRIWSPRLTEDRLRPGMVVVPTEVDSDGALTAVGLLTSLIVDNQIIDIARTDRRLQYHAVEVRSQDPVENRRRINGPLESLLHRLESRP